MNQHSTTKTFSPSYDNYSYDGGSLPEGDFRPDNYKYSLGTWYQIVMIRDTDKVSVYINGEFVGQEEYEPYTASKPTSFFIGYRNLYSNHYDYWYKGLIDELRFYDRVLSQTEIEEIYLDDGDCEDRYDEGYEAGKQYCINNPEACGIVIDSDMQAAYNEGHSDAIAEVKADPSAYALYRSCNSCCTGGDGTDNCATLESNFDITMPCRHPS